MPAKLSAFLHIIYNGTLAQVWLHTNSKAFFQMLIISKTIVASNWVYLGPEEEGRRALQPITKLNPPVSVIICVPYDELISTTVVGNFAVLGCVRSPTLDNYNLNPNLHKASTYKTTFKKW